MQDIMQQIRKTLNTRFWRTRRRCGQSPFRARTGPQWVRQRGKPEPGCRSPFRDHMLRRSHWPRMLRRRLAASKLRHLLHFQPNHPTKRAHFQGHIKAAWRLMVYFAHSDTFTFDDRNERSAFGNILFRNTCDPAKETRQCSDQLAQTIS